VFLGIKKQQRVGTANINEASTASFTRGQQAIERELAKTIAIIITFFSLSWTPLSYTMIAHPDFETYANTHSPLPHWAATVGMATAVVNPLIYFVRKKEYCKAACAVLRIHLT